MADAKPKDSKVFDVAKPGKSEPTASSKPIIVTNRPVLKDPMVVGDEQPTAVEGENLPVSSTAPLAPPSATRITLEPIRHDEQAGAKSGEAEPKSNDADDVEAAKPSEQQNDTDDEELPAGKPKTTTEDDEKAAQQAAQRAEELTKLAESQKYYLPINQIEKRRNKRYAVAGALLIVVLILVWADVALDAGIVTIPGIKAPTHFFK